MKYLLEGAGRGEWLACLGIVSVLLPVNTRADDPKVDAEFLEYLGGMETSTTNWTDVAVVKPAAQSKKEQPAEAAAPAQAVESEAPSDAPPDAASRNTSRPTQPEKS